MSGAAQFFWDHKALFSLIFSAIVFIPYFALQNMEKRKAAAGVMIDDAVPVKLDLSDTANWLGNVLYLDGTIIQADAYGMAVYTWDDFTKNGDKFGAQGSNLVAADFPAVAFFNSSTFDTTGEVVMLRRAKDGSVALEMKDRSPVVRRMVAKRDGNFIVGLTDGTVTVVARDDWYRQFMGIAPPTPNALPVPPPAAGPQPTPAPPQPPAPAAGSTITVNVYQVGGNPALIPLSVPVCIFAGAVADVNNPGAPLVRLVANAQGTAEFTLPAGTYTVVIEKDGKYLGNALDQTKWPTISTQGSPVVTTFRVAAPVNPDVNY